MFAFLGSRRFWKRAAIGAVILVAVGLIANGIMAWRMESALRARAAAIRAAGDPASVADLAPLLIPDDQNAAVVLQRIGPRIGAFANDYGRFFKTPVGEAYDAAHDRGEPPTAEQIAAIRAILDRYPDVDQALAEAAKRDQYASRLDYSLSSDQFIDALIEAVNAPGSVRQASRFLNWRIEVLLADGDRDAAVARGIQTYQLARLYESEPSLIAFLVAVAVRGVVADEMYDALAAGPVSPQLCAALDQELARMDDPRRLIHAIKTDRAATIDWSGTIPGQPSLWLANVFGWPMKSYQIGAIDCANEYLRLAERPWHEARVQFGLPDSTPPPSGHGVLADLLLPAMRAVFQANARSVAVSRAMRIDIALRQFAARNGREATGLEDLDLPQEATIDPYSGEPLKLMHTAEGWVVYSVMDNGMDDGGDFKSRKDYGVAPRKWRLTE